MQVLIHAFNICHSVNLMDKNAILHYYAINIYHMELIIKKKLKFAIIKKIFKDINVCILWALTTVVMFKIVIIIDSNCKPLINL